MKHLAIGTNQERDGLMLLRWHREKARMMEHMHHVLKNRWAAAVLPSGKFGANAAWLRLTSTTQQALVALACSRILALSSTEPENRDTPGALDPKAESL